MDDDSSKNSGKTDGREKVKNSGVIFKKIQNSFLHLQKAVKNGDLNANMSLTEIKNKSDNVIKTLENWSETLDISPKKYSMSSLAVLNSKEIQKVFLEIKELFSGNNPKLKNQLENLAQDAQIQKEFLDKLIEVSGNIDRSKKAESKKIKKTFEMLKEICDQFGDKRPLEKLNLSALSFNTSKFIDGLNELLSPSADEFSNHCLNGFVGCSKLVSNTVRRDERIIFKDSIKKELLKIANYAQSFEFKQKKVKSKT